MNRFIKSSLVASIVVSGITSSSFAADSLAESFSNGKFKGGLKSYYFAKTYEDSTKVDPSIWVNGGYLNYVTDTLNGLTLGATLQTSHVNHKKANADNATYDRWMDASGSVLSESYLNYKYGKTALKAGRQYVSTPLVLGSSSRVIKEAFEAYLVTNTDIPNTTIVAGKIAKYQTRTDSAGGVSEFAQGRIGSNEMTSDGAKTVYVKNNSITNLTLQGQYLDVTDLYTTLYMDALYKIKGDMKPYLAAQYYDTSYDSSATEGNSMYGVKAGVNIDGLKLHLSYTSVADDNGSYVKRGLGQSAYKSYTASWDSAGWKSYAPGADSWQLGASKSFGNVSTLFRYSNYDVPTATSNLKEMNFNIGYKFSGEFKNLKASVTYSRLDYDVENGDNDTLQTKLIYSF